VTDFPTTTGVVLGLVTAVAAAVCVVAFVFSNAAFGVVAAIAALFSLSVSLSCSTSRSRRRPRPQAAAREG
jgi:VIT1/CCC1 family predicted Fe2+/Mn2+ transporter